MVTARVPVEVKQRGDKVLKEIGSSITELVNAAYDYVLEFGELPVKKAERPDEPQVKALKGREARQVRKEWDALRVLETPGYDGANFKNLLGKVREERYESLA